MVVEGRNETITIGINDIEQFVESEDKSRLTLVYYAQAEPSAFNNLMSAESATTAKKRKDEFECAENTLILKTFAGIRSS